MGDGPKDTTKPKVGRERVYYYLLRVRRTPRNFHRAVPPLTAKSESFKLKVYKYS